MGVIGNCVEADHVAHFHVGGRQAVSVLRANPGSRTKKGPNDGCPPPQLSGAPLMDRILLSLIVSRVVRVRHALMLY